MPQTERDLARRQLAAANKNLDWAGVKLTQVAEFYKDTAPEISKACLTIGQLIIETQSAISKIRAQI